MLKWIAAGTAVVLVLVIAAALAIPYVVDTPRVRALISHSVTQALGRRVKFAALSVSVFPLPAVKLKDLEVSEDPGFGTKPFLTIDTGSFRLRVWPLFSGRVEFSELTLKRPQVALIQDSAGRLNISTLGAPAGGRQIGRPSAGRPGAAAAAMPVVSRIRVFDGAVTYTSWSASAPASYRLAGLSLTLQGIGTASPVQFSGEARLHPGDLRLRILEGSVAVAGSRSALEAPVTARVAIEGKNLADLAGLAIGASPQVGGPVKGTVIVSGTLGSPSVAGELESDRLTVAQARSACPEPKRRTLTLDAVRLPISFANALLTSRPFTTKLASGTITAGVTLNLRDGALLQVTGLAVQKFPLAPVLVDFLCEGYAVTGPLDLRGEASARASALWETLSGSGRLRIGPGRVVGPRALKLLAGVIRVGGTLASLLSADLPASLFESPLDFNSIAATYTIRNGVVTTPDLQYFSRAMQISATGRYGLPDGEVNFDLVVKSGRGEIAAKVTGAADSPSIRVRPSALPERRGVERGVLDLLQRLR